MHAALFAAATAVFWASLYVYVPILSPHARNLGAGLGFVGLIVGSYGFTQFVLRLPVGVWSDRLGRRRPFVLAGFAISLLAAAGMATATSPLLLLICRGLSGVAATMWVAFTIFYAAFYPPDGAGRAMGVLNFANQAGILASTLLGGWLADAFGYASTFWAGAAIAGLGLLLMLPVPERPLPPMAASLQGVARVMLTPAVAVAALVGLLGQYVTFATSFGFTPLVAAGLGATGKQLGFLTVAATLPTALAALLAGRVAARPGLAAGYLLLAGTTLATPFAGSVPLLGLLQGLGGVGRGLSSTILLSVTIQGAPPGQRATAMGVYQAVYALGIFAGPAVAGAIGDATGLTGLFASTAAIALAAAVAAWRLVR